MTEAQDPEAFTVPVTVRGYETDQQGHLNQSVYLQYAEHARWSILAAAGAEQTDMLGARMGPVVLEQTIRYASELRAGDEITVSCAWEWPEGRKIFYMRQLIRKTDGTLAAEVTSTGGLMDLDERRLVQDPGTAFAQLVQNPTIIGLL